MIYAVIECGSAIVATHFTEWAARDHAHEMIEEGRDVSVRAFASWEALEMWGD